MICNYSEHVCWGKTLKSSEMNGWLLEWRSDGKDTDLIMGDQNAPWRPQFITGSALKKNSVEKGWLDQEPF
jgi:hypothetical protein